MSTFWSRTLDRLKIEGWVQLTWAGAWGQGWCLGQAIFQQCMREAIFQQCMRDSDPSLFMDSIREAADHVGTRGHELNPVARIIAWNDDPERTFADVEQVLTELHEKALAQGGELA